MEKIKKPLKYSCYLRTLHLEDVKEIIEVAEACAKDTSKKITYQDHKYVYDSLDEVIQNNGTNLSV